MNRNKEISAREDGRRVIWTITTMLVKDGKIRDIRTPAWYAKKEDAIADVLANNCDMWEYLYNFAVVEETPEGMYGTADAIECIFFEWDNVEKEYVRLDGAPVWAEHMMAFGIG